MLQISIIPKRDAGQKSFRLYVSPSRFLSQLTWIEEDRNGRKPGSDFVGTIVRVGPTITSFQVDDHVVGVTDDGTYHSHIIINSQLIIHIPSDFPLTDEQLRGLPRAAGQMCIRYCQYIGAHIIATAGCEEKRDFLRKYYRIEHVLNSRDVYFVNQIRQIFPEDCSFHVIDFATLADNVSPLIHRMLEEALLRCNSGQVMGKTVYRITSSDQSLNINKKQSNIVSDNTMFSSEACNQGTILISGGFWFKNVSIDD
ncbi:unnamed protein product [Adineta steineri]|uniref:Enoyl reductase (ER) domain-containing protein n=1 Tax=Adineta steineri TaxID=433720 RepID=A0A814PB06_9BILA|nr:unnamed protein product [Adineta steineri]CAF4192823.1 unnamed protein product [Adineta steineri]